MTLVSRETEMTAAHGVRRKRRALAVNVRAARKAAASRKRVKAARAQRAQESTRP